MATHNHTYIHTHIYTDKHTHTHTHKNVHFGNLSLLIALVTWACPLKYAMFYFLNGKRRSGSNSVTLPEHDTKLTRRPEVLAWLAVWMCAVSWKTMVSSCRR